METKITFSPKKLLLLTAMVFSTSVYSQTVITVTDCNRDGWVDQGNPDIIATFTTGEAEPLLGNGSLEYTTLTGDLGNFRNESYHNTLLSSLTNFSYSTYIQSRTNNTDNIFVVLQIDRTGDGLKDDHLVFEPRWQTGSWIAGTGLPDQGPTIEKTWQTWDMLNAIWWLGTPYVLNPEKGGIYLTLDSYISQYPDARIVNQVSGGGFGGIRLNIGSPRFAPFDEYWGTAFTGYIDAFTIGINGHNTIYNFEPGIAEAAIAGSTNAAVGTSNSVYTLPHSGATSYTWSITDIDGSAYTDFTGQGTGSIAVDWPDEPNAYKVSVTYVGKEGCPSQTSVLYVHVYHPDAGFVSGGGRSDSPSNADYELMHQSGNMYWGFVAKYRNEDQVVGSAIVILESGPSIFRSTSVEDGSLVISDNRAFFRGKGVLLHKQGFETDADDRRFGYLVTATDGQFRENTGPDQLRLKIWVMNEDGTEGEVVYDNQAGCTSASLDNNAPACDAIDRGAIIIHKPIKSLSSALLQRSVVEPLPQGLEAYPTAFSDRTTLAFVTESNTGYLLELYDLKGALIQRIAAGTSEAGRRHEHELRAEGLPKGLYLARLSTAGKVQTVKLVVER
ncbi:T9SS type A sorting domain-containing protein [Pontibacter pamirensis]|uniref:T9SS type A sorting domain-containing protein n=1 Tax=Pontibacter pamirensis TaxID=2562824 RepID=UPI00138A4B28|nr:T9SS type A sorting domain-containing protein [Pontibacter pamirensis]